MNETVRLLALALVLLRLRRPTLFLNSCSDSLLLHALERSLHDCCCCLSQRRKFQCLAMCFQSSTAAASLSVNVVELLLWGERSFVVGLHRQKFFPFRCMTSEAVASTIVQLVRESIGVTASARWLFQRSLYDLRARGDHQVRHQGHPWRS